MTKEEELKNFLNECIRFIDQGMKIEDVKIEIQKAMIHG